MWLVNFPKVRIKKYPKGYVVEIRKTTWFWIKCWTHIESASGISSEPWYYSNYENALDNAQKHFRWELMHGSKFYN